MGTRRNEVSENSLKKMQKTPCPLPVEEWDFSSCPDEEVEYCCYYEYARSSSKRIEFLSKFTAGKPEGITINSDYPGDADYSRTQWLKAFFGAFRDFPAKPWLRYPKKLRQKSVLECRKWRGAFISVAPERGAYPGEDSPFFPPDNNPGAVTAVYTVEVDWALSNDAVENAFKIWLAHNRPFEPIIEGRGSLSSREKLKMLGAYRLIQAAGGVNDRLFAWSNTQYDGGGQPWAPQYREESAWNRAKRNAKSLIDTGNPLSFRAGLIGKLKKSDLSEVEKRRKTVRVLQMNRSEVREAEVALAESLLPERVRLAKKAPKASVSRA